MKKFILIALIIPVTLFAQQTTEYMFYDGNNREFILYIPSSYSSSTPTPLLFAFHGGTGYADDFMNYEADFRPIADTAGFILVYPQALGDPNDCFNTSWLHKDPTDHKDIFFVEAIIDTLSTLYNIDSDRIYACGYSLGGMFSYELACNLNYKIAAISSVSGAAFIGAFGNCDLFHPTAVLTINGTADNEHPYNDQSGVFFPVPDINDFWASQNNTDQTPVVTTITDYDPTDGSTVERYSWLNGDNCVYVEELKVINGGHQWPGTFGNMDIDASNETWRFVSKFNTSGLINCSSTNTENKQLVKERRLVKRFNLLGKEVKNSSFVIDFFDNGNTKKVFVIE